MKKDVEIWRDIIGYEGLYKVSTMGRVKNLRSGKILKPWKTKNGYLQVGLWKNGKQKHFLVHRLVAQAFLNPVAGKDFINHLNEVKTDNHYSNLEWCTQKENCNWGSRNERAAKAKSKAVVGINPGTGKVVVEFPSTMEAGRNGFDYSAVARCCRGEKKTYKGYIWRYRQ